MVVYFEKERKIPLGVKFIVGFNYILTILLVARSSYNRDPLINTIGFFLAVLLSSFLAFYLLKGKAFARFVQIIFVFAVLLIDIIPNRYTGLLAGFMYIVPLPGLYLIFSNKAKNFFLQGKPVSNAKIPVMIAAICVLNWIIAISFLSDLNFIWAHGGILQFVFNLIASIILIWLSFYLYKGMRWALLTEMSLSFLTFLTVISYFIYAIFTNNGFTNNGGPMYIMAFGSIVYIPAILISIYLYSVRDSEFFSKIN